MAVNKIIGGNSHLEQEDARRMNENFAALDAAAGIGSVTASAAELNILDNAAITTAELNTLSGVANSVTTAATPASGTCAVQFVFKNAAAATINNLAAGICYFSNSAGTAIAAPTSAAVLTNGALTILEAAKAYLFMSSAVGLLGITVTAPAGTYYVSFILPNGKVVTSSALVVNA